MKSIAKIFSRQGYEHVLIKRNRVAAIYEVKDGVGGNTHYEVLRIHVAKTQSPESIFKREIGDEYLPSPSKWGEEALTIMTSERALAKYDEMTAIWKTNK